MEEMEYLFQQANTAVDNLNSAFGFLYKEAIQFVLHSVHCKENLRSEARKFFNDVGKELNWSPKKLQRRIFEVETEIANTGQYEHTQEELEIGARLAWRNSAKCIGR